MKNLMKICNLLILSVLFYSCSTVIDGGYEGVKVALSGEGKGQGVSLASGRVFYNPLTEDVFEFPVHVRTVDYEPFTVNAKDGSIFEVDPTLSYQIVRGQSPNIFRKYRVQIEDIEAGIIRNEVKDAFKNVFNNYTTDDILSKRQQFDNQVTASLVKDLQKEGFEVAQMTFGMRYPQTITQAIDQKNKAIQEAIQARNSLVKDSIDAQRRLIVARAEKEANELKQQSLTPMLIQQQFIEKWDGKTPLYGESPVMFKSVK